MQAIENVRYFLDVIFPKSILDTLYVIDAFMSSTVAWILLLFLIISLYCLYIFMKRLAKAHELEQGLDEILLLSARASSVNELYNNFINLGLYLGGEYIVMYQLQGETYVLLTANIDLNSDNSPVAASLHVSKREVKEFHDSGNYKIITYKTENEKYLLSLYARNEIDIRRYEGKIESLFSRYASLKNSDENSTELQLAKTSRLLFDTINGTRFGDDGYMRYLLSMVKKVIHAQQVKLFSKNQLKIEIGDCAECLTKVFYIRNTSYRVEIGTLEEISIHNQSTVGSFLDLTGVFMSTLSQEGAIAKNYITFLEEANHLLESEDEFKKLHSEKVTTVSLEVGKVQFLTTQELSALKHASRLHDIGSITNLNDLIEEGHDINENYKLHPLIGSIILEPVANIYPIASIIKYHHERYDGKGYPFGIKGDAIPKLAQILALGEYYIGLISNRSSKQAYTHDEAIKLVAKSSNKMFEKIIVDSFLSVHEKINKKIIQLELKNSKP